jgi:DNA-binding SARP family transcriptional activator
MHGQAIMNGSPRLRLFGGFSLCDASGETVSLTLRKTEALIAYLAAGPSRSLQRELLASLLWSESAQASALQSLRQARLTLMRNLDAHALPIVDFSRREISLDDSALEIDVVDFARLQAAGDQDSLARAVELYRGEFLAGLEVGAEAFDDWLQQTRTWYREQVESALEKLLALQEQAGAHESAVRTAKRILALDPLREDIHRWLMRAFAASGHRTSALAAYDACRALLEDELDVTPDPETEALYKAILLRAEPAQPSQPVDGRGPLRESAEPLPAMALAASREAAAEDAAAEASLAPISNLSSAALEVLQMAAVCDNHFSLRLLDAVGERSAEQTDAAIRELREAGLLQWHDDSQSGSLPEAVSRKVLVQLMPSHRRHLHYAAAVALEELAGPDSSEDCYEIAGHYRQAARWALAVPHQLKLAKREIDEGNLDSAEPQLKRALADLAMLPAGEDRGRLEVGTQLLYAGLAELRGDFGRAAEIVGELWPGLKLHGNGQLWIGALLARSRLCFRNGQLRKAFSSIRLIPQGCKGGPMENFWLLPERFAGVADFVTAEGCSPAMMRRRHCMAGPRSGEAEQAAFQALCHAKREKFAAAYTACSQAMQISENLPDPTCLIASLQTLGIIQVWHGEAEAALAAFDRAQALAVQRGDLLRQYTSYGYRGFALIHAGRPAEAVEDLTRALDIADRLRLQFMTAMFSAWLAEALIATGAFDRALDVARRAVRLANERNEAWARSVALRVLGQALALSTADGAKLVDRILRSAQEMQSSLGLPFETARTAGTRAEVSRVLH